MFPSKRPRKRLFWRIIHRKDQPWDPWLSYRTLWGIYREPVVTTGIWFYLRYRGIEGTVRVPTYNTTSPNLWFTITLFGKWISFPSKYMKRYGHNFPYQNTLPEKVVVGGYLVKVLLTGLEPYRNFNFNNLLLSHFQEPLDFTWCWTWMSIQFSTGAVESFVGCIQIRSSFHLPI